jgi:hypothetical protein
MAGDWIKMRCSLGIDPKVMAIANQIEHHPHFAQWLTCDQISECPVSDGALRCIVTGALHAVWSAANEHAVGGRIAGANLRWVDVVSGIEGFGEAMQSVGWAVVQDGSLVFPKFDNNNTSAAERQRRWREKHRNKRNGNSNVTVDAQRDVTRDVTLRPRVEKRREEKSRGSSAAQKKTERGKNFSPPTVDEVRAYCQERGNNIDPQYFIDKYTANGWMVGKARMKDWKATVRTWEQNDIPAGRRADPESRIATADDAERHSFYGAGE